MQLFLVLTRVKELLEDDQQKPEDLIFLIKDHLLKVLIHPLVESQDQEITVQDLMIN